MPTGQDSESPNVARFLPRAAQRYPDGIATRIPRRRRLDGSIHYQSFTFSELNAESDACARLLQDAGLQRSMRVLVMVRPGLDLLLVCFALFKLGAIPIVIDPGMKMGNFLACVRKSRPEAMIGVRLAHFLARFRSSSFLGVRIRVQTGTKKFRRDLQRFRIGEAVSPASVKSSELAAILFTSGSTGSPKGVCYQHGVFDAQIRLIRERYAISSGEVDLTILPIFGLFNPALGMTTVVPEINPSRPAKANPEKLVQAIAERKVTNAFGSPTLWRKVADHCNANQIRLPSLKRILIAGASAPPELLLRLQRILPNASIHIPYGATEALPVASVTAEQILAGPARLTALGKGTCLGRPLNEIDVCILPIKENPIPSMVATAQLALGEIGEITVRGPIVTTSYDNHPEANAAHKVKDGENIWHRMGDLGYFDEEGRLWFCGRKAERVETIDGPLYTEQVEPIFHAHVDVRRSALIGIGKKKFREPAIVIEPESGAFPKSAR
ncbi:MAG: fatty acid CoA ligase family protein, partial [Opitutales bacterium]